LKGGARGEPENMVNREGNKLNLVIKDATVHITVAKMPL
jgi:hypothetical protein